MSRFVQNVSKNRVFFKSLCTTATTEVNKTAGVIVIGDEILKGEVEDTNSQFLSKELHNLGLKLKKISVIGDDVREVSEEVRCFSEKYSYVITSGGIGPTHDDITFEAIAQAFRVPLVINPELKKLCYRFYKTSDPAHPGMKLATIPLTAKLNYASGDHINYPVVSVNNVYIFPGIPELLRKAFLASGSILFTSSKRFFTKIVYCKATEDKLAQILNEVVKEYPQAQFGSYPKLYDSKYQVKITVESSKEELTEAAHKKLLKLLPKEYIVE